MDAVDIVTAGDVTAGDVTAGDVTAGDVTSGIDLALWLVERYASPQIAHSEEKLIEYERRVMVWRSKKN